MNIDMKAVFELIKRLVLMIFEKYEVLKEFEALGIDIVGLLNGISVTTDKTDTPATPATPSADGRLLH